LKKGSESLLEKVFERPRGVRFSADSTTPHKVCGNETRSLWAKMEKQIKMAKITFSSRFIYQKQ
jgi:hypothetical protein